MRNTWQSWLFALLITFTLGFGSGYSLHWALSTPPVVPTASTGVPSAVGMHLFIAVDGLQLDDATRTLLQDVQPGGVVLRAQNLRSAAQVLNLVREIKATRVDGAGRFSDPPFIALAPDVDAAAALGVAHGNRPRLVGAAEQAGARQLGRDLARAAADRGINLLLGPILEVHTPSSEYPEIVNAAYDTDPVVVATYGLEEASGMLEAGLLAAPAYFPGYASATRSRAGALPVLHQDYAGLAQRMFPFNEAVSAGVHGLVVAHVHVPTVEPDAPVRPASQSPKVLGEILRGLWGFDGVLLADDITGARANLSDPEAAAIASLAAGCDVVLMLDPNPERVRSVVSAVEKALASGKLNAASLEKSRGRLARWQQWLDMPSPGETPKSPAPTQVARSQANVPDDPLLKLTTPMMDDGGWEPADPALAPEPDYSPWPDEDPAWSEPAPASAGPPQGPPAANPQPEPSVVASLPPAAPAPTTTPAQDAGADEPGGTEPSVEAEVSTPDASAGSQGETKSAIPETTTDEPTAGAKADPSANDATEPTEPADNGESDSVPADAEVSVEEEDMPEAEPELRVVSHPVQPGEDLTAVAKRYDVDPAALKEWNQLNGDSVAVGQSLDVRLTPERADSVLAERQRSPFPEYKTVAYKVKAGDTLTGIARDYSVAVEDIVKWNNLPDREIQSGRTLKIYRRADAPSIAEKAPEPAAPPAENEPAQTPAVAEEAPAAEEPPAKKESPAPVTAVATTYTVQAGDTLTRISGLHGVTPDAVMKLNNITDPNHIFVGQKLKIPE